MARHGWVESTSLGPGRLFQRKVCVTREYATDEFGEGACAHSVRLGSAFEPVRDPAKRDTLKDSTHRWREFKGTYMKVASKGRGDWTTTAVSSKRKIGRLDEKGTDPKATM